MRVHNSIKYFFDLIVRRKWPIVTCVLLCLLVGGGLAWVHTDVYRSSTVIVVEQHTNQDRYVVSAEGGDIPESISSVIQQVVSRTNLKKVIDEFHLSADIVKRYGYEPVIERFRENVRIDTKGQGGQLEALTISFAHHDPMMAMKVTAQLASQFIQETAKQREQFLEGATEFLDRELVVAQKTLEEKESELSEYNGRFLRELPNQLETNLRTLDRLQFEKIRIQEALHGLHSQLVLVRKSILHNGANRSLFQGRHNSNPDNPSVMQLSQAKKTLEQMTRESIGDEAGIIFLTRHIEKLEAEQFERLRLGPETLDANSNPYLTELENERDELNRQMVTLKTRLKATSTLMADVEGKIQRTPEHAQVLSVLERQYDLIKEHYQHLHQKRLNVRISENLDTRQKQGEFRILDLANLPVTPEGWSRTFIVSGWVAGGVGMGFGVACLLDFLFPTFRRSRDVELSLEFPVLATIPRFQMAYDKPMKMLSMRGELPVKVNGKANRTDHGDYVDVQGMGKGKSVVPGKPSGKHTSLPQLNLVSKWRPHSIVAEQFRVAATQLDLLGDRPMGNVALVSSAMKGEGKTSTTANLAYTLARDLDEPILVIDCDFTCPNLHNVLALRPYPGVADYLAGQASLESCFQQYPDLPLQCLSVGDVETCPVSLARLRYLSILIDSVRSRYRFILLDGPPILPLADISVLNGLADIFLMVVRSGATPKDVVQKATEMLHSSNTTRIILTDAWSQGVPHYVGHRESMPSFLPSLR